MSIFFNYNGKLFSDHQSVFGPDNRSFKFGDGVFETMRFKDGKIIFSTDHFERLFNGLKILKFNITNYITAEHFEEQVQELAKANNCYGSARIRLTCFRKDSDLTNPDTSNPDYIIQAWSLQANSTKFLKVDLLTGIFKSCDQLSNLKTNNFLPYIMAMIKVKESSCDECVVLNAYNRICDASRGNIFIVVNKTIYTPPLSEGCVAGVMRKNLIALLKKNHFAIIEKSLTLDELQSADEMFITNVTAGIQPVSTFLNKTYQTLYTNEILSLVRQTF